MRNRMDFMEEEKEEDRLCPACMGKLYNGTAIHTYRLVHWDCLPEHVKNPVPLKDLVEEGDRIIGKLKALSDKAALMTPKQRRALLEGLREAKKDLPKL